LVLRRVAESGDVPGLLAYNAGVPGVQLVAQA
jgi:hypothetical protein